MATVSTPEPALGQGSRITPEPDRWTALIIIGVMIMIFAAILFLVATYGSPDDVETVSPWMTL